jgi:hypothetical protein
MKKTFALLCLLWFCNALSAAGGEITYLDGLADIERGSRKISAAINIPVMPGDKLTLKESASMVVKLENSGLLKLTGPAGLEISPGAGTRISTVRLFLGSLWSEIKGMVAGESFKVLTLTATCGVRGTVFEVSYDPQTNITTALVEQGSIYARNAMGHEQTLKRGMVGEVRKDKIQTRRDLLLLAQRKLHFSGIPRSNNPLDIQAAEKARLQAQEQLENARKWQNRMDELQQKITPGTTDESPKSEDWRGGNQKGIPGRNKTGESKRLNLKKYPPYQNRFLLNQLKQGPEHRSTELHKNELLFREQRKRTDRLRILRLQTREAQTRHKIYTRYDFESRSEPEEPPADTHYTEPLTHSQPIDTHRQ